MDAQKPDNDARLFRNPTKNLFLSVNTLTLFDRFRNDAALGWRIGVLSDACRFTSLRERN